VGQVVLNQWLKRIFDSLLQMRGLSGIFTSQREKCCFFAPNRQAQCVGGAKVRQSAQGET
jgi:hypothetical protein